MREQFQRVRSGFSNDSGLPFGKLLTRRYVTDVLAQEGHQFRARVFDPLTTLWAWISQCVSQDKSLNDAVAKIVAHWVAAGLPACSASSASYSDARRRFPESALARMAQEIGRSVAANAPYQSLWRGRSVYLADGTTLTMPDTDENQLEYPQPDQSRRGLAFPLMRVVALVSLGTGAVADIRFGKYIGKGTGESALFRSLMPTLSRGDILVADKYYCNYPVLAMLVARSVDVLCAVPVDRVQDSKDVIWHKPPRAQKPIAPEVYAGLPDILRLRQVNVTVEDRDGEPKALTLITTLTDRAITDREITELYRQRWNCELDLRAIKCSMQLDVIRAKTPDMVRKEIHAHILTYNLLRGVMAQAASRVDTVPRSLSVKGAMQLVESFTPSMMNCDGSQSLYDAFLSAVASHRVGNRPNRKEPRLKKRRPKWTDYMKAPRHKYPRRLAAEASSLT